ncbi:hypothetical protein JNUCC83_05260 [Vagococcus sp. JNUCC 83]
MKTGKLVIDMSNLKAELKLIDDVDMDRYNRAYIKAIDMIICKTGNINHVIVEYEYFKSLVH